MSKCTKENVFSINSCLTGMAMLCISTQVMSGTLYKWIDENGNIRYSDRLPPNQVKRKHQQLNSQGVVVTTQEAAKTRETLAAEAEAKKKNDAKMSEEARLKKIQDNKDMVLLLTFSSENELSQVKDDRLEVLNSVIRLINKSITTTQAKLARLETHANNTYTLKSKDIPGGLAQNIEHLTRKIENRDAQLRVKQQEKNKIDMQYEVDLARYRYLKNRQAAKSAP